MKKEDVKCFDESGKYCPCWVYFKDETSLMCKTEEELDDAIIDGCEDSPARFIEKKAKDIPAFHGWGKQKLIAYAKDPLGFDLDPKLSQAGMVKKVQAAYLAHDEETTEDEENEVDNDSNATGEGSAPS